VVTALDPALAPVTYLAAVWLKALRRAGGEGLRRLPRCRQTLRAVGIYPVRDHYYEPLLQPGHLRRPLDVDRDLPGLDLNVSGQLEMLESFNFAPELTQLAMDVTPDHQYYYNNGYFESGDAEFFYSMIRLRKPRLLIEVGSGFSSLLAIKALEANRAELPGYACRHICIEPFERPWLQQLDVEMIRTPVERCDLSLLSDLTADDILFIDSSHVIRPQGDVLFEYLELLPRLKPGVFVHIHDIFTPRDYPRQWLIERTRFWNEQYLVEAFLSFNSSFEIVGALNYLKHHHPHALAAKCPILARQFASREPGSLWLRRVH
jgi:hypothetical protein